MSALSLLSLVATATAATATTAGTLQSSPAADTPADPTRRYALVVGYNASSNPARATLRYADDDAARFFEMVRPVTTKAYLLTEFDRASKETFSELRDLVRTPSRATLKRVISELEATFAKDKAEGRTSELYFYYAGHGEVVDGVGMVNLSDGPLTRPDFKSWVLGPRRANAVHVIVDACKSYYFVAGRGPGGKRVRHTSPFKGPERINGVGYVLSTTHDADSHEWSGVSGGVFSHEIRSALLGAADVDGNGHVGYEELEAFVAVANGSVPFPTFRPEVFVQGPGGGQRPIFSPKAFNQVAWLTLPKGATGRVRIVDERGLHYADVHKTEQDDLRVALVQPRSYDVRWRSSSFHIGSGVGTHALTALDMDQEFIATRGAAHQAFEHLYEAPFGRDVMRGYLLARRTERVEQELVAEPPTPAEIAAPWVITAGAVAAITGAALAAWGIDQRKQADSATQAEVPGLIDRSNRMLLGSGVSFGAGLLAIGIGTALLF